MERSLPFVCPAVRCGLTAIRYPISADRYPLSVEMVFPNEVIDFRLSDFRLQTLDSIDFTYHSGVPPLVAGATTLPGGKHVTGFAGRLQLPYESSSFATPRSSVGRQKESASEFLVSP